MGVDIREQEVEAQEHQQQPKVPLTLHSLTLVKEINNFSGVYILRVRVMRDGDEHGKQEVGAQEHPVQLGAPLTFTRSPW